MPPEKFYTLSEIAQMGGMKFARLRYLAPRTGVEADITLACAAGYSHEKAIALLGEILVIEQEAAERRDRSERREKARRAEGAKCVLDRSKYLWRILSTPEEEAAYDSNKLDMAGRLALLNSITTRARKEVPLVLGCSEDELPNRNEIIEGLRNAYIARHEPETCE